MGHRVVYVSIGIGVIMLVDGCRWVIILSEYHKSIVQWYHFQEGTTRIAQLVIGIIFLEYCYYGEMQEKRHMPVPVDKVGWLVGFFSKGGCEMCMTKACRIRPYRP